ncbi:nitroreductase family deazaflavin-dependent oxidoreductase [Mycolicibacterium sediminis]|uniref:nitroreductase family deazaflavin-dependent oxidoreductase n=1 Tax=Mycolicibacterium sediminis TaxID=1286180 RepID=UPI0013D6E2E3|nr:nitroreductase family deazaflavin-dependent oxidoreductase [Mycolicibacterium sediminis]
MSDTRNPVRNASVVKQAMKYFARGHVWAYQHTGGVIGSRLLWLPSALITTTGRRSGRQRVTATLCLIDGDRVVLPASFGGRDENPAWYLNIGSDPHVRVQYGSTTRDMTARDATDDERADYWPRLTRMYPPYRDYRQAADRVIPLVVCEPA